MKVGIIIFFTGVMSVLNLDAKADIDLEDIWESSKNTEGFNDYLNEFAQWNNSFGLDTKHGCYDKSPEAVTLFLLFTDKGIIESVKSNSNTEKALCFKKTYKGLKVKKPPFSPLVIKMDF